jgi:hypothetical protein
VAVGSTTSMHLPIPTICANATIVAGAAALTLMIAVTGFARHFWPISMMMKISSERDFHNRDRARIDVSMSKPVLSKAIERGRLKIENRQARLYVAKYPYCVPSL